MARLIIHVGPGKCGSSSIQDFFSTEAQPCIEDTSYSLLSAIEINKLDKQPNDQSVHEYFENILTKELVNNNTAILSHEYLFQVPSVVNKLCQLAKSLTSDISVIGYCRQQSNFMISQYSQWLFRSKGRVNETIKYIEHIELDWKLFTGLERQIIASVYNDFVSARMLGGYQALNWNESYQNLAKHIQTQDIENKDIENKDIKIYCGLLPSRNADKTLIEDFCEKTSLSLTAKEKKQKNQISNPSFSKDIVEAIDNAIAHGREMPGPHAQNSLIHSLSSKLNQTNNNDTSSEIIFLNQLKAYIDGYFWESNKTHCDRYKLDFDYFANPEPISKAQIIDIIKSENDRRQKRSSNTIDDYRELNAKLIELCIKLGIKLGNQ